ncbi:MAG TPA: Ig-like domain repeat protein [Xanthomonadales bacterium]|nr:Ig-like domain repeat protein [Xanthomonadales bacterium]
MDIRHFRKTALLLVSLGILLGMVVPAARAQLTGGADRNTSQLTNYQNECAIAKNPTNKDQLFASCNTAGAGLYAARSVDGGLTWTYPDADKTIADGDAGQGALACCDPTLAWDTFGNLYVGYLGDAGSVEVMRSTDAGLTFTTIGSFAGSVDQPTLVAENTTDPSAPVALWVVWNQSNTMRARGAAVTGLGASGAFTAMQTIPGTTGCSFGDVAIAPSGAVVQACQNPTGGQGPANILVNTDADGLGAGNFAAAVTATATNVGGFDFIPAQNVRSIDAEAGLAYDRNPMSPHVGRLYLMYTEEAAPENNDTNIMVRFSDDDGGTWSAPVRVDGDPGTRSQFLPKIASNRVSGNVAVCWHDARNSAGNNTMQEFCNMATPAGANTGTWIGAVQVSDGTSTGTGGSPPTPGTVDIQYGDYSGMAYFQGIVHPIWADNGNSAGGNPDLPRYEAYTDRIWGGMAAMEGDPHLTSLNGVHWDFQSSGEFVALRGDGLEIQTRQTAAATTFFPGENPHTGLATCASLNTAVAARVGKHRVTYQPNISGVPDPSGLQLRIDGELKTLGSAGIDLDDGARITRTSATGGIQVKFATGTRLVVTPGWWDSQKLWYLNVNVYDSTFGDGLIGAIAGRNWLPNLPDGTASGPRPAAVAARYDALYRRFADAWRVRAANSLFDYAPGTDTSTFTLAGWPPMQPPCEVPNVEPAKPLSEAIAKKVCRPVVDKARNASCVFDVRVTGDRGFAKTYLATQELDTGNAITLSDDRDPTKVGQPVVFTAQVVRPDGKPASGAIQFVLDGRAVGRTMKLDERGRAQWRTADLKAGRHVVVARYKPGKQGDPAAGASNEETHEVRAPG